MFSFYARGMAFIDLAYLTKENIQGEYIIYRRHKTGQELSIKLEICLKTIIDRYSHYSNGTFLFPILSESTQNYDSALRLHNIHLKKISGFMGLPKPLTSYVARHSWATLAKKKVYLHKSSVKVWDIIAKRQPEYISHLLTGP